jgi:hypothetical protein
MIRKEIKGRTRGKRGDMSRIEQEQRRKTKKDKGPKWGKECRNRI